MKIVPLVLLASIVVSCGSHSDDDDDSLMQSPKVLERHARFEKALAEAAAGDTGGVAIARWVLPHSLQEVSGLVVTGDGRLLAHGDESGLVAAIDYRSGVVLKEFMVGKEKGPIDFEGITVAEDDLYMIVSDGRLYQFREGSPGEQVSFAIHETGLKDVCEFEGVAYDASIASLLLVCKNIKEDRLKDSLVIFRWRLPGTPAATERLSRLTVPVGLVMAPIGATKINPSDITVDPRTGNYVIIAAQERALIELTPAGQVLAVRLLPEVHEQAEGVAVTRDGVLIISDEAVSKGAVITLYRML